MFFVFVYAVYILIPLGVTLSFKRFKNIHKGWTYGVTGILIFFYPYLVFALERLLLTPPGHHGFGEGDSFFLMGHFFLFLPLSLGFQGLFNYLFRRKKNNAHSNIPVWVLLLGTLCLQSCQAGSDSWPYAYNDWEINHLSGNVKSVVKKAYSPDSTTTDNKTDRLFGHEEKYFNSDGLLTKDILYRDETTELGYSLYQYDAEKNELIEQQYRLNDQKEDRIISTLDDKGQSMMQTAQDKNGDFHYQREYTYDSTNSVLGDAVEIKNYTEKKNHLTTTEKYRYNAVGNKTEETLLDKDGVRHHYFYRYNAKDQLTQLIRHGYDDAPMDTLTYRYRYDSAGNWIRRKIYKNGQLNAVVKREIRYYE